MRHRIAAQEAAVSRLPSIVSGAVPGSKVSFCRPLPTLAQFPNEGFGSGPFLELIDVILANRAEPPLVALFVAYTRVLGAACVAREARRPTGHALEGSHDPRIGKEQPHAPELVVYECVHRVEDQRPHGWLITKGAAAC
jgi:hypothetical protein